MHATCSAADLRMPACYPIHGGASARPGAAVVLSDEAPQLVCRVGSAQAAGAAGLAGAALPHGVGCMLASPHASWSLRRLL